MYQTLSVRYFSIWDVLLDSLVGLIFSWAIPSRRRKLLSSGNGNFVEWDCLYGFWDLFVGFVVSESVCSLYLDLKYFWDSLVGQTLSVR